MVKQWIFMVVLSIILALGCIFESTYINNSFKWLVNSLETLQIDVTEKQEQLDTEELIASAYSIHENWHKKLNALRCLVWHTWLKDIEVGLARIAVYIEENNYTETYAELASLIDCCAHYLDDFNVSLANVL